MKLTAPIYYLKRKAKLLSRQERIPLHEALDRLAIQEGYRTWGMLAAKHAELAPAAKLFARLVAGDLLLVGARPGQGKTLLSLELAVEAMRAGGRAVFFTLEYNERDVADRLRAIGVGRAQFDGLFELECSDAIDADYIIGKLAAAPRATLVVIDYLQLLDQRRENAPLAVQVGKLKAFARARGLIIVCISQIDRSYDPLSKPCPDLRDIRLPNPVDLKLFNKTCFLNCGEVRFGAAG